MAWRDGKTSSQRGYGYRWQKARAAFLGKHPLCRFCERMNRVVPASVVDHVQAHKGDETLFWAESNWQPLCKPCHDSTKQSIETGSAPKRRTGADGYPVGEPGEGAFES